MNYSKTIIGFPQKSQSKFKMSDTVKKLTRNLNLLYAPL